MIPAIVFLVVFGVCQGLGWFGVKPLKPWYMSLRVAMAAMFMLTSWAHFGPLRADLVRMVPPFFPAPELLVTLTGLAEVLGAIGLLIPATARPAAVGLALLLLAMFPANVHAALAGLSLGGRAATPLLARTLLQVVFLAAVLGAGFGRPRS